MGYPDYLLITSRPTLVYHLKEKKGGGGLTQLNLTHSLG